MVNICEDAEKQTNKFIQKQVEERKNKYSVYDLYKNFSPTTIYSLKEKSEFMFLAFKSFYFYIFCNHLTKMKNKELLR